MSDKNEYWNELFGEDQPEDLLEEDAYTDQVPPEETASDWFSLDEDFFKDQPEENPETDVTSATNVIPNDAKDLSYIKKSGANSGVEESIPPDGIEEPEAGDADTGEDQEGEGGIRVVRRKRTGLAGGLMYFIFIAGMGVILASLAWLAACDVLALNKEYMEAEVVIPNGFTIPEVAGELQNAGLIEYKFLFQWFAAVYNADEKIEPGTYSLKTDYDYRALISNMHQGSDSTIEVTVTIPEGKTLEETFAILEELEVCSEADLMDSAANYDFDYTFLDDTTLGAADRLEGYLFPDTYNFYKNIDADIVIDRLLSNFNTKMEENGIYDAVAESAYTLHEIVTIASMLEKEAASADEMPTVASVVYNRLNNEMLLQIDATIQYALDERKENLTLEDLEIDSLYNTYLYTGLPPTPIANPGVAAIKAALEPESTEYFYYALHVDGYHEFFRYLESHEAFTESEEYAYYSE